MAVNEVKKILQTWGMSYKNIISQMDRIKTSKIELLFWIFHWLEQ